MAGGLTRRIAALAALALLAGCGRGGGDGAAEGDMALGAAEGAKVTVVEYASVTCGACAGWNAQVWPDFKAKYVDTGKVRYVFREFPTPPQEVAVAGFLIARCAGGAQNYFHAVDAIMRAQPEMHAGVPARTVLQRVAAEVGVDEAEFQACVSDKDAISAMEARIRAAQAAGVTHTPTFMVNGQLVADRSLAGLSAAIDPLLAGG